MSTSKKLRLALASLVLWAVGQISPASAATTGDINVTVTVDFVSVSVASASWAIGQVTLNSVSISSVIAVTNNGNRQEDLSLNLTDPALWTAASSVGANQYTMLALFTNTTPATITNGDFVANDALAAGGPVSASATAFGVDADPAGEKGYDIAAAGARKLLLNFRAPSSNTATGQQSITVTVTASAG